MDLIGYCKTDTAIVLHRNHHTTSLSKGQVVEVIAEDSKHRQLLVNIEHFGLRILDLKWKTNLIKIF